MTPKKSTEKKTAEDVNAAPKKVIEQRRGAKPIVKAAKPVKESKRAKKLVEQSFKCNDCDKTFEKRKIALLHHRKTGHTVEGKMTYEVKYSGKTAE